jgi:hypothetical protein
MTVLQKAALAFDGTRDLPSRSRLVNRHGLEGFAIGAAGKPGAFMAEVGVCVRRHARSVAVPFRSRLLSVLSNVTAWPVASI